MYLYPILYHPFSLFLIGYKMIDLHNHVLPDLDDGSKSMKMSINMLKNAVEQGITTVVNTVHYQHPKVSEREITDRNISIISRALTDELKNQRIPIKLYNSAEVFFLPNLLELKSNPLATFGHGKYMLIEFLPHHIPEIQKQVLFDLKMNGVTPIIAHPERYKQVQKNINFVYDWLNAGCLVQVDAGSILGYLGKKSQIAAEKIIKNKWCQILSSDAHNDTARDFCLKDAFGIIQNWIGHQAKPLVSDYPKAILEGSPISFEFEFIPEKAPTLWQNFIRLYNKI